jgi:tetratricopeptide (TPR) repeat protein
MLTLADIAYDRGDLTRSLQFAKQAIDIGTEIDDLGITMEALNTAAKAELALHNPRAAIANYTAAESIALNAESRQSVFAARYGIARAWIEIGDYATAAAIADELLADSRSNERRREETAGLNLHAEVFLAQEKWPEAIAQLHEVLGIASEIGDSGLVADARTSLARALLETGQVEEAEAHIAAILEQRPPDTGVLKLQAHVAAQREEPALAVDYMTAARSSAGEAWESTDDEVLETYRDAAAATASR